MKNFVPVFIVVLIGLTSCEDDVYSSDEVVVKACVDAKITDFEEKDICSKSGDVKEYVFQNQQVYVFNPGDCGADMTAEVIDANCTTLGYLGGITGNTKINGVDFSNASYVRTLWRKDPNNKQAIQQDEATQLANQKLAIENTVASYSCTNESDWTFMAIGSKACGGPEGYIAFPKSIAQTVMPQIESYTQARKEFDIKWGMASDCAYAVPPSKVTCNNGKPELVY